MPAIQPEQLTKHLRSSREFFERVEHGFLMLAKMDPERIKLIDATASREEVQAAIWAHVAHLLAG